MKHKKINQNLFRCFSRICKNSFCLLYLRDDATRFQIFFFLFCLSSSFFTSISVCFVCVCVFLFGEDLMLSCLTSCFFFLSFAFAMIRINYAVSLQLLQLRWLQMALSVVSLLQVLESFLFVWWIRFPYSQLVSWRSLFFPRIANFCRSSRRICISGEQISKLLSRIWRSKNSVFDARKLCCNNQQQQPSLLFISR